MQLLFFPKADLGPQRSSAAAWLSTGVIKALIQRHFGKLPDQVGSLRRGTFHLTVPFTIDRTSYIARFAMHPFFKDGRTLAKESAIADFLGKNRLQHSQIIATDITCGSAPFPYQIQEASEGRTLLEISNRQHILLPAIEKLGAYVGRVHQIPVGAYGWLTPGRKRWFGSRTWLSYLKLKLNTHLAYLHAHTVLSASQAARIAKSFNGRLPFSVKNAALLHGDVAHHNAWLHKDRDVSLFDWEDAMGGDPVWDISFYGTGCYLHDSWLIAFLAGYRQTATLPGNFDLRYWYYYVRIALVKAISRIRVGRTRGPSGEPLEERISYGLSMVESLV